ncbi:MULTISPECIES: hypothetical protein [Streptomyces violaceusniger group]|uniref:Uncharacterized protein n=2 Tax=Streptomyces antimycoticus TaxID=68175 RepID=A0ABD5J960_9ACTN|nr:hypothetical protein [Streptomyces violaceusniger]MEE4584208.1 hypothetical protein [Streptomyces sp. DSM 41602]
MKGTGFIQILKTVLLLAAFVLLAALVLKRFSWNPFTLFDAAADASGTATASGSPAASTALLRGGLRGRRHHPGGGRRTHPGHRGLPRP